MDAPQERSPDGGRPWLLVAPALAVLWLALSALSGPAVVAALPELSRVPHLRAPVVASIAEAVIDGQRPRSVDAETARAVGDRSVADPALIGTLDESVARAHRDWLDGQPFVVDLASAEVHAPVVARARDLDAELGRRLAGGPDIEPQPATLAVPPVSVVRALALGAAVVALLAGLAGVVGIVSAPQRAAAATGAGRRLAVGALGAGAVGAVLALPVVRSADQPLAGAGALVAAAPTRWWTVVLLLAALGWAVGVAARHAAGRSPATRRPRPARRRRTRADALAAIEARQQAHDAFFGEASGSAGSDHESHDGAAGRSEPSSAGAEGPASPGSGPRSADQQRAEALAADRRAALERIDGTSSSPLRTSRGR